VSLPIPELLRIPLTHTDPKRYLTLPQSFAILKAIEDVQTVTGRVYQACDTFLEAVTSHGSPGVVSTMKKSISELTASSYSMISSQQSNGSGLLLGGGKRGWDWRDDLPHNVDGETIIRILRLGLAKELARAWIAGDD
jgi:hypothetical protein